MSRAWRIAVIADDLTGACDTGVQFSSPGSPTTVYVCDTRPEDELRLVLEEHGLVIVDTESRHETAEEAYDRVLATATHFGGSSVDLVYKKIDSTLRGNVLSELGALQDAFANRIALIAPAYPAAGRTVVDGSCIVNGRPVHETEFGGDRRSPVTSARLADYVRPGTRVVESRTDSLAAVLRGATAGDAVIVDAATDGELDAVAAFIAADPRRYIAVGSAGLAGAIHRTRKNVNAGDRTRAASSPSEISSPVLGIVGSVSERSRLQAARLRESRSVVTVVLDPMSISAQAIRVSGALSCGQDVLLITPVPDTGRSDHETNNGRGTRPGGGASPAAASSGGKPSPEHTATAIARALGDIAREVVDRVPRIGLFMTGGDTALSVMHALHSRTLIVYRELAAGIPIVTIEYRSGDRRIRVPAITKAGGFGSDTIMVEGFDCLRGETCLQ